MQRLIAQWRVCLPILALAIVATGAPGQERPKGKYKIVTFDELRVLVDVKKDFKSDFKKEDKFKEDRFDKKEHALRCAAPSRSPVPSPR